MPNRDVRGGGEDGPREPGRDPEQAAQREKPAPLPLRAHSGERDRAAEKLSAGPLGATRGIEDS